MGDSSSYMTPQSLRGKIRRTWRELGLIEGGSGRPGISISALVSESRSHNRKIKINTLELWLIVYDEYLSWYISFFMVSYEGLEKTRLGTLENDLFRCFVALSSKIVSDLLAIRRLCLDGFDVAAKTLLRSTIEYIDVLTIIALDPEISREFVETQTNEKSNEFWNDYFRGGRKANKARRMMRKAWEETGVFDGYQEAVEFDEWLYEKHDILVMSSHPSFSAGAFSSLVMGSTNDDNWLGLFGLKGEISRNTIHEAIMHSFKFLNLCGEIPFSYGKKNLQLLNYRESDELHKHTKIGRRWLISFYSIFTRPGGRENFFRKIDISNIWPDFDKHEVDNQEK